MGTAEEASKVVVSVADSMKSQPLALALIIVNALFLAFFVWLAHEIATTNRIERDQRATLIKELQTTCADARQQLDIMNRK